MTKRRDPPPARFGICDKCNVLQECFFTGTKSTVKCVSIRGGGNTRCIGTVHLPTNRELQAAANAAFRVGGAEAARAVLQDYFDAFLT